MSNITVVGGGNVGSLLAIRFSQKHNVILYVSSEEKSGQYSKSMRAYNTDSGTCIYGRIKYVTGCLEDAVQDAEWIFVTYPSFMYPSFSEKIMPFLHYGQHLVGVPGSGGFELYFRKAIELGCTISGLQRVHAVARITDFGREVRESGVRSKLKVASVPSSFNSSACDFISDLFCMPVDLIESYLSITLVNSNPLLHTSRLYRLFHDYPKKREYESVPMFYEEWDTKSSNILIELDSELFSLIDVLSEKGLYLKEIVPLLKHYESNNAEEMTEKLRGISSLSGLKTPVKKNDYGNYIPDFHSRYFIEDFPLGLDVILSFANIVSVDCKKMTMISDWYHEATDSKRSFRLDDFGINTVKELIDLYKSRE